MGNSESKKNKKLEQKLKANTGAINEKEVKKILILGEKFLSKTF